jgi:hypothetical protein
VLEVVAVEVAATKCGLFPLLLALLLPGPASLAGPIRARADAAWQVYTRTAPHYRYRVEYPSTWSVEESGDVTFFIPPSAASRRESIAIAAIDYRKTPPPPVAYTYTPVRTVVAGEARIEVRKRAPAPVTERYIAQIQKGDYTFEFRFALDPRHDNVFDRMLTTFQ